MNQRLVVILGGGSIGKRHALNFLNLGVKTALVETKPERQAEILEKFGLIPNFVGVYSSLNEVPSKDLRLAAVICLPTDLHLTAARECLSKHWPMMIEKPIAHLREGMKDFLQECAAENLLVMVGYNLRFHPGLKRVQDLLKSGAIGRPLTFLAQCGQYLPDWHPWEDYRAWYMAYEERGGGATTDISHEFDYLRSLFGEATAVSGYRSKLSDLEINTDDASFAIVRFKNGVLGSIYLDLLQRVYQRELQVVGTEGTIRWSYHDHKISVWNTTTKEWRHEDYQFDRNSIFVAQDQHFLDCLEGVTKPLVDGADAFKTLEIVLAIKELTTADQFKKL